MTLNDITYKRNSIEAQKRAKAPPISLKAPLNYSNIPRAPPPSIAPPPLGAPHGVRRVSPPRIGTIANRGIGKPPIPASHRSVISGNQYPPPPREPIVPTKSLASLSATNNPLPTLPEPSVRVGEYTLTIGPLIGEGGFSEVREATTILKDAKYALKIVNLTKLNKEARVSILNEVRWLQKCSNSPYIINLIASETIEANGVKNLYILLELAETDLKKMLNLRSKANTPLDLSFVKYWGGQIVQAVKAVHKQNIVHQDLKPANFLVVNGSLKLCDFGISNVIPDYTNNLHITDLCGTMKYLAPEAFKLTNNEVKLSKPCDVWSIGLILYEMTYGKHPVTATVNQHIQMQIERCDFEFPETTTDGVKVPMSLIEALVGCMQADPASRLTVDQVAEGLFFSPITVDFPAIKTVCESALKYGIKLGQTGKKLSLVKVESMVYDTYKRLRGIVTAEEECN